MNDLRYMINVKKLAEQAGIRYIKLNGYTTDLNGAKDADLETFAALVLEEAAKACVVDEVSHSESGLLFAEIIRAMKPAKGNKTRPTWMACCGGGPQLGHKLDCPQCPY